MARDRSESSSSSSGSSRFSRSSSSATSSTQGNIGVGFSQHEYSRLEDLAITFAGNRDNRCDRWKLMECLYDWDNVKFGHDFIEGKGVTGKKIRRKPRYFLYANTWDWAATPQQFYRAAGFILNGTRVPIMRSTPSSNRWIPMHRSPLPDYR